MLDEDRIRRKLDEAPVTLFALSHLSFRAFAIRNIAVDAINRDLPALDSHGSNKERHIETCAVLPAPNRFDVGVHAALGFLVEPFTFAPLVLRHDQPVKVLPDRFIRRVPEEARKLPIHLLHDILSVHDRNRFGSGFEELLEIRLLNRQTAFGMLPAGNIQDDDGDSADFARGDAQRKVANKPVSRFAWMRRRGALHFAI